MKMTWWLAFWEIRKKIAALKNPINYFIHKMIHHSLWYYWIKTTKTVKSIFFLEKATSLASFLLQLTIFTPISLAYKSFSSDTSDKTTFHITSSCLTVCWRKVASLLHSSSTSSSTISWFLKVLQQQY